jgi:hypothetical protein
VNAAQAITEANRMHLVLFGMQNRTIGPYWQPLIGFLMQAKMDPLAPSGPRGPAVNWTSGAVYSDADAAQLRKMREEEAR